MTLGKAIRSIRQSEGESQVLFAAQRYCSVLTYFVLDGEYSWING